MFKKLFLIVFLFSFQQIFAQKDFTISEVVTLDNSFNTSLLYSSAVKYFSSSDKSYIIRSSTQSPAMIDVKIQMTEYLLPSRIGDKGHFDYDLTIYIKDNKYKIICSNFSYSSGLTYLYFGGRDPSSNDHITKETWEKIQNEIKDFVNSKGIPWVKKAMSVNPYNGW